MDKLEVGEKKWLAINKKTFEEYSEKDEVGEIYLTPE